MFTGGFGSTGSGGAFGSGGSGFGTNTSNSSGGLFGNNNSNTNTSGGFGGFGSTSNTSSGFGSGGGSAGGGGLFGSQNKTSGFGSASNTGGSLFGGSSNTSSSGAFGTTTGGAFGTPSSTALGGNVGDPPGTAVTPFSAFQEREPSGNSTQVFQNILFQDAYKKWSGEELRLADYAQGRRHGNASGAGAFGVGTGFGGSNFGTANNNNSGFGSTNTGSSGGLFGSNTTTTSSSGFGSTTATSGGFGSGGGLFGQNKPSSSGGGLFGGSTANTTGGFSTNTGTGFGTNTSTTASSGFGSGNTGGGLFGQSNANKPAGLGFGSTGTSTGFGGTNTGSGFGNTQANTGGLFGSNTANQNSTTGSSLLGNSNTNQQSAGGGLFGSGGGAFGNNTQTQNTGGGLFGSGNQQQKSGGLFGSASTAPNTGGSGSGGLFGSTTNNATGGFGAQNSQQSGGGLFGSKPATTGGGLFGSSTTNTGTTGGLFGQSNQNQSQSSGGLFGSSAAQTQQKPSLFGASTTQNTGGGGLFGGQNTNQGGGSIFGSTSQNQQNSGMGSSLFGASQNTIQGNNQPTSLTASINDMSAYGSSSLFSNLGANEAQNPGPLATPLSNRSKPRRSSILPMYKLNPASASRYSTPQKRGGFGFSYSTYGTPSSSSSVTTTGGLNQSLLLGNSMSLKQSVSTSNLRRSFNAEDTILAPGAFSTSGQRFGSVKKLVINREVRGDLFSTPQKDKTIVDSTRGGSRLRKHVSFEDPNSSAESTPLPLPAPTSDSHSAPNSSQLPAPNGSNGTPTSSGATPEIPQVVTTVSSHPGDKTPGHYWMRPSLEEIQKMSRTERSGVQDFTVGRVNVGSVQFLEIVDLNTVDVENLFKDIVELIPRSATVYKISSMKPPMGKGLNVPAKISLEQSWPRNHKKGEKKSSNQLKKHIDRLRRIPDTTFLEYNDETGVWTFRVEHFTTYGLDYDEDEVSDIEPTPDVKGVSDSKHSPPSAAEEETSPEFNPDEDTFDFRRKRLALPGAFDQDNIHDSQPETPIMKLANKPDSFLGDHSVGSVSNELAAVDKETEMEEEHAVAMANSMVNQASCNNLVTEPEFISPEPERLSLEPVPETPGGIMRARMRAIKDSTMPTSMRIADGDDWMDMLQRTISPQKRDRALLKTLQTEENYEVLKESARERPFIPRSKAPQEDKGFATSIDLMNSLFEKTTVPVESPAKGFVKVCF